MSNTGDYTSIGAINVNFLKACFGFWLAWVTWQMVVPGLEVILILTVIAAAGGIKCTWAALWLMGKMYAKDRKIRAMKAKGAVPKADPMANVADMRDWRSKS